LRAVRSQPKARHLPLTWFLLGWQCLALEVDETDGALDILKAKEVEATWGPVKRPDYAGAEIHDPDGNPIELRQWYRR
jgi:glyoxylase I family protein